MSIQNHDVCEKINFFVSTTQKKQKNRAQTPSILHNKNTF